MAIHKHFSHDERLSHAHECIVHSLVSMGMVFTKNIANHSCTFPEGLVVDQLQIVHGKQYSAVDRLQPIASVRKSSPHDHRHRILHVSRKQFIRLDALETCLKCLLVVNHGDCAGVGRDWVEAYAQVRLLGLCVELPFNDLTIPIFSHVCAASDLESLR